jgi:polyvinyl alcohol dehydrogenase (cytochrome)
VVSNGMVYVQAGYWPSYPNAAGHVLLAFGL